MGKFELEEYIRKVLMKDVNCRNCVEFYGLRDNCEICEDMSHFEPIDNVVIDISEKVREIVKNGRWLENKIN
jgi:recombinational DNA repair protein RecR